MIAASHSQLMAQYNEWMNSRMYALCASLPDAELRQDRDAFFKSIYATLNQHILRMVTSLFCPACGNCRATWRRSLLFVNSSIGDATAQIAIWGGMLSLLALGYNVLLSLLFSSVRSFRFNLPRLQAHGQGILGLLFLALAARLTWAKAA